MGTLEKNSVILPRSEVGKIDHTGRLQDLYYSLLVVTTYLQGQDAFSYTIVCFDAKIGPKSTKWYDERYCLAQIHQEKNELMTSFVTRLRTQAQKCDFAHSFHEEAIQGQIINGCASNELRVELMKAKSLRLSARLKAP